jgi:hypothetical protein
VTIAQLMSHQAGLCAFDERVDVLDYAESSARWSGRRRSGRPARRMVTTRERSAICSTN